MCALIAGSGFTAKEWNPASPVWTPLQTNTLTNGSFYFSDPRWTNYPARFHGLGLP
jgi:hypothetical protein